MKLYVLIAVLVGLYFIFTPKIDIDNVNKQVLLWYGRPDDRNYIKLFNWK